ncbi:MAG: hypothetical protein AAGF73_01040 [Actinomycetota bacterium]
MIVVAAGLWRVAYVLVAKYDEPVVGDQIYYSAQAVTIANGSGFNEPFIPGEYAADHAPLTAVALAPVSWSNTDPYLAQRLAMAVYGTAVVAGIGALARWLFGRTTALAAAAIAAVYANLWMNDGLMMSETFAAAGVVAILLAVYVYDLRRSSVVAAVAGVAVGVAGLARAELLLLGPIVVVPMILLAPSDGRPSPRSAIRWQHVLVSGAAALVVVAPWVGRNLIRFDETTLMSTQDGLTLIGANCETTYGGPGVGFWDLNCADLLQVPDGVDQSERSALYRDAAVDYIGDNLDRVPAVLVARLGRGLSVWDTETMIEFNVNEGREPWASRIGLWQYWLLVPLAAYGWWRWPSAQPRWPVLVTGALSIVVILAFYGIPRFRIAAEIAIVLGAAVSVDATVQRVVGARRSSSANSHSATRAEPSGVT